MAGDSNFETKPQVLNWLAEIQPITVLDIGAGKGPYVDLVRANSMHFERRVKFTAVEVFEPYVKAFGLEDKYDNVIISDAREIEDFSYDLVIFGDVLEHMTKEESIALWEKARAQAKYAIIAGPIIYMPQHGIADNPYEDHIQEDLCVQDYFDFFPGIIAHRAFQDTGAFLAKFK